MYWTQKQLRSYKIKKITKKKQKDYKKETNGFNKKSEDKVPAGINILTTIYIISKKKL